MYMQIKMLSTMNRSIFNQIINHNPINTWSPLATAFNSKARRKLDFETYNKNVGLFAIPELKSHEGFYHLRDQCNLLTEVLIDEVTSESRSRKMVEVFDELSDSLCKVADLSEFIRIAHTSTSYTKAAEKASSAVSGIVEKLNTNRKLYDALHHVITNGDKVATTEVDYRTGKMFLFDFEQSGIHLPETERLKVLYLNDFILQLGQHFLSASTCPRLINKNALPQNVRQHFTINGDAVVVPGLCADSSNPVVREIAYRLYLHPDEWQEYLLNELLNSRHELAQICGFATYADRALKESTIEKPERVMEFLNSLSDSIKEHACSDFRTMSKMKESVYGERGPLACWDIPYFTKKFKKQRFNVQSLEYSPYFSLGGCMEGLNNLLVTLYGISLVISEIMPGECWAKDVYKIAVTHETEGLLGYIYCDFYERAGKLNQDCHYTIRGGRMLPDGSYQNPIVVLMLNFPVTYCSGPTLLSPTMVDNLFHEMGHAMHSMLARTQYQHVAGTRCSTDFAEVPSVLMEYFASDIRVLKTFARHFQTNKPMPEDMLRRLCASKHIFSASEMQVQLFYAVLDQLYHGKHPLEGSTTDVLARTQDRYYTLPYIKNTAWQLRFSHLIGYGAKYYSYLLSRALASCIWQNYFVQDPFNRKQGERYRHECLAYGGGKPSRQILTDFLQKEPTPELLVQCLLNDINYKQEQVEQANVN